jgi:hypothetical protein
MGFGKGKMVDEGIWNGRQGEGRSGNVMDMSRV